MLDRDLDVFGISEQSAEFLAFLAVRMGWQTDEVSFFLSFVHIHNVYTAYCGGALLISPSFSYAPEATRRRKSHLITFLAYNTMFCTLNEK